MKWFNAWMFGAVCLGIAAGCLISVGITLAHSSILARENEQIRIADNRMLRSRSNFQLPKFGSDDLEKIKFCADTVRWPWELLAAIHKTENGGTMLEVGATKIADDIRKNYPPTLWQDAMAQRILIEEAGAMILAHPEILSLFVWRLGERWKAEDTSKWKRNFLLELDRFRGKAATESAITQPTRGKNEKSNRDGHGVVRKRVIKRRVG